MLRFASHLPDSPVWLVPVGQGTLDRTYQYRPDPVIEPVPGFCVQVERVEQSAPDVMLALARGCVPYPDGTRPFVAVQVIEDFL